MSVRHTSRVGPGRTEYRRTFDNYEINLGIYGEGKGCQRRCKDPYDDLCGPRRDLSRIGDGAPIVRRFAWRRWERRDVRRRSRRMVTGRECCLAI
ncbi:hypothetical protein MTP99_016744 [Tenebrio molitor]|nr:hypothetical protein MTP99_016744 [Tenebrio molitor]